MTFQQLTVHMFIIKSCRWLDLNRGSMELEITALPTESQPLPFLPFSYLYRLHSKHFQKNLGPSFRRSTRPPTRCSPTSTCPITRSSWPPRTSWARPTTPAPFSSRNNVMVRDVTSLWRYFILFISSSFLIYIFRRTGGPIQGSRRLMVRALTFEFDNLSSKTCPAKKFVLDGA